MSVRVRKATQNNPRPTINPIDKNEKAKTLQHNRKFAHVDVLLLALLFPFGVLASFGGKSTIIVIGFGSLVVYIFDLLGTKEGSIFSILVSSLTFWVMLIWEARLLIYESYAYLALVGIMGLVILSIVLIILSQYQVVVHELYPTFYMIETLLFASIPLVATTILTWFICVELPFIDVSICFSIIYFIYIWTLGHPRKSSFVYNKHFLQDNKYHNLCYTLSKYHMILLYIIPISISPLLTIVMKWNILSITRITDIVIAFLFPILLMILCLERQFEYWNDQQKKDIIMYSGTVKLASSAILFACAQDHPLFDDMKSFSTLSSTLASATLCGAAILLTLGIAVFRFDMDIYDQEKKQKQVNFIKKGLVDICIGAAGGLIGVLLRLPLSVIGIMITGSIALAEYYQRCELPHNSTSYRLSDTLDYDLKPTTYSITTTILLALLAVISASAVALTYGMETIFYYTFTFHWDNTMLSIKQFVYLIVLMISGAVLIPLLLYQAKVSSFTKKYFNTLDGLLPTSFNEFSSTSSRKLLDLGISLNLFQMFFSVGSSAVSAIELLIRYQDWSNHSATVNQVYPNILLISTALLMSFAAFHLYNCGAIRPWCIWTILISQLMKLTHLIGVSSADSLAAGTLLRTYTFPFIAHCIIEDNDDTTSTSDIDPIDSGDNTDNDRNSPTNNTREYSPYSSPTTTTTTATRNISTHTSTSILGSIWTFITTLTEFDTTTQRYNVTNFLFLLYCSMAAASTYYANNRVIGQLLLFLTWKESGDWQHITACICMYSVFLTVMSHVFRPGRRLLRSFFLILSLITAFMASDVIRFSPQLSATFPYILINTSNNTNELLSKQYSTHTGLFSVLSICLILAALTSTFPTTQPPGRILFGVLFTICASSAMYGWAFGAFILQLDDPSSWITFPNIFTFLYILVSAFTSLQVSMSRGQDGVYILFTAACLLPVLAIVYTFIVYDINMASDVYNGIIWTSCISSGLIGVTMRTTEIMRNIETLKLSTVSLHHLDMSRLDQINPPQIDSLQNNICIITSIIAILWAIIGCVIPNSVITSQAWIGSNTIIPISTLFLLCTYRSSFIVDVHPLYICAYISSLWWIISAIYSIFILVIDIHDPFYFTTSSSSSIFQDGNVSFWSNDTSFIPILHMIQLITPLPVIIGSMLDNQQLNEEILFILSIVSFIPVIGSKITSLRYLGLVGSILGFVKCQEIGSQRKRSNRLI